VNRREIRVEAERDVFDAALWYEQERAGLGFRFQIEVTETVDRAVEAPRSFPVIDRGVRRAQVGMFPYAVFFLFEGDLVTVIGVLHLHRHPNAWKRRA